MTIQEVQTAIAAAGVALDTEQDAAHDRWTARMRQIRAECPHVFEQYAEGAKRCTVCQYIAMPDIAGVLADICGRKHT